MTTYSLEQSAALVCGADSNGDPLPGKAKWLVLRLRRAHQVTYIMLVGPIPSGLQIDHLCLYPPCVNPAHLEPVTPGENTRRYHAVRRAQLATISATTATETGPVHER